MGVGAPGVLSSQTTLTSCKPTPSPHPRIWLLPMISTPQKARYTVVVPGLPLGQLRAHVLQKILGCVPPLKCSPCSLWGWNTMDIPHSQEPLCACGSKLSPTCSTPGSWGCLISSCWPHGAGQSHSLSCSHGAHPSSCSRHPEHPEMRHSN